MTADIATYARSAYAAGYAHAGPDAHPIPPAIAHRMASAVRVAETHVDHPQVIEATLNIGKADGIWAVIFNRRAKMEQTFHSRMTAVMANLVRTLDVQMMVDDTVAMLNTRVEAVDPVNAGMTSAAIARQLRQAGTPERADVRQIIRDGLASGLAEGSTDAKAILTDAANLPIIDFNIVFDQYQQALAELGDLWSQADGWLADILDGLASKLGRALAAGVGNGASRAELLQTVSDLLSTADEASALILDHAIAGALSEGALALYSSEGVTQVDFTTAGDDRVCLECDALEAGNSYTLAEAPTPPEHFRCFPAGTVVSGPTVVAATERWYGGELVEIRTASGRVLTGTPNHPILTPQGWVPLGALDEGGDVVSRRLPERESGCDPDDDEQPTLIEDVAAALRGSGPVGTASVPVSAMDFHGDGTGGNVQVVTTDRLLLNDLDSPVSQHGGEFRFGGRDKPRGKRSLPAGGDLATLLLRMDTTSGGDMSRFGVPPVLLGGAARHHQLVGFGRSANNDVVVEQKSTEASATYPASNSESVLTFAVDVTPDQIVSIRRYPFEGQVHNLETVDGWYFANDIIVHNCRCVLVGVADSIEYAG